MYDSDLFISLFPDFLKSGHVKSLAEEDVYAEMALELKGFSEGSAGIACPDDVTFGFYAGDPAPLQEAVRQVDPEWVRYYGGGRRYYCAFRGGEIISFCILDTFGEYRGLKVGGPGCVGTVPPARGHRIGLKMVEKATAILKEEGYDLSFIHYTGIDHWYARLGYVNVARWNCRGLIG